jgi:hypothetical protein
MMDGLVSAEPIAADETLEAKVVLTPVLALADTRASATSGLLDFYFNPANSVNGGTSFDDDSASVTDNQYRLLAQRELVDVLVGWGH